MYTHIDLFSCETNLRFRTMKLKTKTKKKKQKIFKIEYENHDTKLKKKKMKNTGGSHRIPKKLVLRSIFVGDAFSVLFSTICILNELYKYTNLLYETNRTKRDRTDSPLTIHLSRYIIILRNAATIVNIFNN